tara:strand:- start:435 stop:800 length:366 start_codon:yes stop_codon:yes gene_type:complete
MAITYTWDCKTVDTYPTHSDQMSPKNTKNDVVYNVHYRLLGSETKSGVEYISDNVGTAIIDVDDLSTFTEFASLTNNVVTGWVTASLEAQSSGSVDVMKAGISQSIVEQIKPPSVTKYIES